jgi:hypothetical protein
MRCIQAGSGGAYGIRTRATAVRGRRPRPLDECARRAQGSESEKANGGPFRPPLNLRRACWRSFPEPQEDFDPHAPLSAAEGSN